MKYKITNGQKEYYSDSLEHAIRNADQMGQGYKVYQGKTVVYEQQKSAVVLKKAKSKILALAKAMTTEMKKIGKFIYSNSGCSGTFASMLSSHNYRCNCATLANWIFRKLKIIHSGEYFYGKKGGTIQWSADTEASVTKYCDVFKVDKTVKLALDQGVLQPGDVCCYDEQHTNIYAGGSKWYEAGTVYADGSSREGTPIRKFYGGTVLYDHVISWVIRYKDPAYTARARQYRVQCGVYAKKAKAKEYRKILLNEGIKTVVEKCAEGYVVQAGMFSMAANAANMTETIRAKNLPCMIIGL